MTAIRDSCSPPESLIVIPGEPLTVVAVERRHAKWTTQVFSLEVTNGGVVRTEFVPDHAFPCSRPATVVTLAPA